MTIRQQKEKKMMSIYNTVDDEQKPQHHSTTKLLIKTNQRYSKLFQRFHQRTVDCIDILIKNVESEMTMFVQNISFTNLQDIYF